MSHLRRAAILANEQLALFHGQMRPAIASLASGMMFGWYASHSFYMLARFLRNVNL
jgi:hypothetical protein